KGISEKMSEANDYLSRGNRLFVAGLREMDGDKVFYPDANFTMRLTYGSVQDYFPGDAVRYEYFTTLDGVMEKEDPDNWEFVVPDKLKELWENKDYGIYGEGEMMPVCFLTDHDITGGNSGSPVINGDGALIGLAFDGNWEAMSGDIAFEPALQRTINVDIRYVLFIIDKYAGAQNIIDELTIVK
ncbi:MAG: S46 family peptidase, partial [Bacteroidales bacterium]|nr:S46 family peptidase [Bacteroidales bacterium]